MKSILNLFLIALLMLMTSSSTIAQNKEVRGIVFEPDGSTPIPGATIILKGTSTGTITNVDGEYRLNVFGSDPVLVVQFLGFQSQEAAIANRSIVNFVLQEESIALQDVVVTALGLTREQKSLGYAVTKVDSEDITQVSSRNWLTGMSGKVAGLSMSGASSGPVGSMRVTLRGDLSLNYGSNEALFVVDGVPVRSGTTATSSSSSYTNSGADFPVDFGNGASDINPEDIESVSVLKGPAATALYGSRAANGAIVITTKSGRKDKGIGVTVNSSVTYENAG
ncbi:MAG: TonB-dependent receptor plug domain-containing protein, partial [Bacteroidales bacterium]|nr:TonB-dependent receptor plug domain-containing protein [Bacteroidales bacterium]